MAAGELRHRFRFDERGSGNDGYGNTQTGWVARFTVWGGRQFFRGVEAAQDEASNATQKLLIKIRASTQARTATTGWRVVDVRTSQSYNVLAIEPTEDRAYIKFIVETGVPDG